MPYDLSKIKQSPVIDIYWDNWYSVGVLEFEDTLFILIILVCVSRVVRPYKQEMIYQRSVLQGPAGNPVTCCIPHTNLESVSWLHHRQSLFLLTDVSGCQTIIDWCLVILLSFPPDGIIHVDMTFNYPKYTINLITRFLSLHKRAFIKNIKTFSCFLDGVIHSIVSILLDKNSH